MEKDRKSEINGGKKMTKGFEEELKHNKMKAWYGYIRSFSKNCFFMFKHITKGQRTVKCKRCGVKVPKDVPRIYITGSWYYYTGHYCLKCAEAKVKEDIEEKQELASSLQDNLAELIALLKVVSKAKEKEAYKDKMAIHYLNQKLTG